MVCPFPQKLLIFQWLPVLSGSNPELAHVSTQGVAGPPTPNEKNKKKRSTQAAPRPPPRHPPKKKKKRKRTRMIKKDTKKKRELSLRILPWRTRLLTSHHREKARKAWRTATILMRFSNLVKFMYARNIK